MNDYSGLILAALIALGIGWVWNKGRKKFGKPANGKTHLLSALAFFLILLIAFDATRH
ncbi:MAG TPA: hypothetical protein VGG75_27770 [Trebonia sp.]|jgi:hypothetical protein